MDGLEGSWKRTFMGDVSLSRAAQITGRYFGAAARIEYLNDEGALRDIMLKDCMFLTPEIHLKWNSLEWQRGEFNFTPVDELLAFAERHGKRLRGHTLIWEQSTPEWARASLLASRDWRLVDDYFARVLSRYRDRITEWDVVNEPIDTQQGRADLRMTVFERAFGPTYIERALHSARAHAPHARLIVNDYGFDYENAVDAERRAAFLRLLARLKKSGAPLDGVGLQAHLDLAKGRLRAATLRDFMRAIAESGLDITITELDVKERDVRAPLAIRDRAVADHARQYLEIALAEPAVRGFVTWGLSDRYSWLSDHQRAANSNPPRSAALVLNRGLPFDDAFAPKPMYRAIHESLCAASADLAYRKADAAAVE